MKEEYYYRFHPSILRTNRQIEREASHVLYAENLLVRVSSCGRISCAGEFGRTGGGHAVPILANGHRAKQFTHHVMEFIMLRDYETSFSGDPSRSENCFIIASNDLYRLCWALLVKNLNWDEALSRLTLAIEVRRDIDVPTSQEETTAESQNKVEGQARNEDGINLDKIAATDAIIPMDKVQTSIKCNEPQTRRLLEPFRRLHSIQAVHIEGPIIEQYKVPLLASMQGPGPSDQELLDEALAMLEDALITYDTGNISSAVTKMKYTLDTVEEHKRIAPEETNDLPALRDAYNKIKLTIWTKLGWASLKNRENDDDVMEALYCVETIMWTFVNENGEYWNAPPMGHETAMVFYMWADIWEALDDLGYNKSDRRSSCLAEVVSYLCHGLRHEPGNKLLQRKLRRREEELRSVLEVEALIEQQLKRREEETRSVEEVKASMEMFDRMNETEDFAPPIYLGHDEDDKNLETEDEGEGESESEGS